MNTYKVDDILIFGNSWDAVVLSDLDLVVENASTEFHLLRHFSNVSEAYKNTLLGLSYEYFDFATNGFTSSIITENDIEAALLTRGSKFLPNVSGIENPKILLKLVKTEMARRVYEGKDFWITRKNDRVSMFSFQYDIEVGYKSLVTKSSLSPAELRTIKTERRGLHKGDSNTSMRLVSGISPSLTRTICIELIQLHNANKISITAYPGSLAPDFPNEKQAYEERLYSEKFWNEHVWIEP